MIVLKENLRAISFIGAVLLGIITNVTYTNLKTGEDIKWKTFFFKLIVAFFVCLNISPFIQNNEMLNKYYPQVISILAFSYQKAIDWIHNDLFPLIRSFIMGMFTNKHNARKDDE